MIEQIAPPLRIPKITEPPDFERTRACDLPGEINARSQLPTFPLSVGQRTIVDSETGETYDVPLTLLDILYQTDDDVGVVHLSQNILHDIWCPLLAVMLQSHLTVEKWFVTHDVLIHWGWKGVPPKYPDVAAMPDANVVLGRADSYYVGIDGPLPAFIIEITSDSTRDADLNIKPTEYAAKGIKEYLIFDMRTKQNEDWALIGYRLGNTPYYDRIKPNPDGSVTFETVNLRFLAVGRDRIEVYDTETSERLLTPDELKEKTIAETERADVAESQVDELSKEVEELKAQLRRATVDDQKPSE